MLTRSPGLLTLPRTVGVGSRLNREDVCLESRDYPLHYFQLREMKIVAPKRLATIFTLVL